jgi:hypothetical protein
MGAMRFMKVRGVVLLIGSIACVGPACHAYAMALQFDFSGSITEITSGSLGDYGDDIDMSIGDLFTGTLLYDSSLPDTDPEPSTGCYGTSLPSYSSCIALEAVVGYHVYPFGATYGRLIIQNDITGDRLIAIDEPMPSRFISIVLSDSTGMAFSNDALPTHLNLLDWDSGSFDIWQPWGTHVTGTISGPRSVVPDTASTSVLLSLSLLLLGGICRTANRHTVKREKGSATRYRSDTQA